MTAQLLLNAKASWGPAAADRLAYWGMSGMPFPCASPQWPHVLCSREGMVVGLSLTGLRLTGTIPQALIMMPGLRLLFLSGNYFSGPFMYAGPDLEVLDLSGDGNNVTVSSVNWLSASSLSYLDLSGNPVVSSGHSACTSPKESP